MTDPDPAFLWETEALRNSPRRSAATSEAMPPITGWATLTEAYLATGIPTGTLRKWARREHVPSRLVDTAHGERRLLDMDAVFARAAELGRKIGPVEIADGGRVADSERRAEEAAKGRRAGVADHGEATKRSRRSEEATKREGGARKHGEVANGSGGSEEATKAAGGGLADHGGVAERSGGSEEAAKAAGGGVPDHSSVAEHRRGSEEAAKAAGGGVADHGGVAERSGGSEEAAKEPESAPAGTMIVPIDAWEKMLLQLGNLHEAGQQLAEARERAAKAETEAHFLRERLAEHRARSDEVRGEDGSTGLTHSESGQVRSVSRAAGEGSDVVRRKATASYVSGGEPWDRRPVIETWWQYVERRWRRRRRRR